MKPELILDARADLAEGPLWHARSQRLFWVDIDAATIHQFDPITGEDLTYDAGSAVGAVAIVADGRSEGLPETLLIATRLGIRRLDLVSGEITATIADPESHLPNHRFNDGKCDPAGRFWAGTLCSDRAVRDGASNLYVLETDGTFRKALSGVTTSNGLGWSPDRRTMYYNDTPTHQVAAFDYDLETGSISGRRVLVQFSGDNGRPDGMTVDAEGTLWVAHWAGARVTRWSPDGRLLDTIHVPALNTTSCTFGGPELSTLFITTALEGMTDEQQAEYPHAGGIFAVETDTQGQQTYEYGG